MPLPLPAGCVFNTFLIYDGSSCSYSPCSQHGPRRAPSTRATKSRFDSLTLFMLRVILYTRCWILMVAMVGVAACGLTRSCFATWWLDSRSISSVRVKFGLGGTACSFIVIASDLDRKVACGGFEVLRCLRKVRWQILGSRHYPFQLFVAISWSPVASRLPRTR